MAKKKLKNNGLFFTGKSAEEVTGSQFFVRFGNSQFLIECGLYQSQSNSYLDAYKVNSAKFKFNPSELDFVFVAHPHIDHVGLIPRLVKEGFSGKIIATENTAKIMKPLLLNSAYIIKDEARILSKKYKREYKPLYEESDVYAALNLIEVHNEYNQLTSLNSNVSFRWIHNSHCIGAAQLQLVLKDADVVRKILYTSDIGSLHAKNHYVSNTDIPDEFHDYVIMEGTYGDREVRKTRKDDLRKLKSAIDTTIDRGGSVIMPCFSFSRTQEVLTSLYDIYGQQNDFQTQIFVDSKLSCDICSLYSKILDGKDLDIWNNVVSWKNVHLISDKEQSQACLSNNNPKIVISSSGFCTNGRVVNYLKKYVRDRKSIVVFSGYTGDNPSYLSYRIKNYKSNKFISINKEKIPNKADCISLSTFSSHADKNDLVKYGSSLNTTKLIIVHANKESKMALAHELRDAISRQDKTYQVAIGNQGMKLKL